MRIIKHFTVIAMATIAVVGCAACGGSPDGDQVASNKDEMICRTVRVAGSNIPQRVCRSRAQRDHDKQNAREAVDTIQNNTTSGPWWSLGDADVGGLRGRHRQQNDSGLDHHREAFIQPA